MKQALATFFVVVAFLILTSENGMHTVEGQAVNVCERLVLGVVCPPEVDSRICLTECSKLSKGHNPVTHYCLNGKDSTYCYCQWIADFCN
ncbi:hypothetical protein A4A49_60649 [Nicotiana attenuata]|uniref:Uncharacterized protein n=1 Tax=Nicotiana attenuata TaxID=49451 RepID=A0A1J6HVC9_NICAT|nr:hypothetical protein A4A49_60649 [Nicotiana attenuata]